MRIFVVNDESCRLLANLRNFSHFVQSYYTGDWIDCRKDRFLVLKLEHKKNYSLERWYCSKSLVLSSVQVNITLRVQAKQGCSSVLLNKTLYKNTCSSWRKGYIMGHKLVEKRSWMTYWANHRAEQTNLPPLNKKDTQLGIKNRRCPCQLRYQKSINFVEQ